MNLTMVLQTSSSGLSFVRLPFPFQHSARDSKFVLRRPVATITRLGRYSRYEEGKKVVHDVGRGDACDISVVVSGCDFDDVCAARGEGPRAWD